MKKLTSTLFAALLALAASQSYAAGPQILNTTKHTFETKLIKEEGLEGYGATIDGKPCLIGDLYIMLSQMGAPMELIMQAANETPVFLDTVEKIELSVSMLCPGSAGGETLQAFVTEKGQSKLYCFASYANNTLYAVFDMANLH